jgi:hypothetical protein
MDANADAFLPRNGDPIDRNRAAAAAIAFERLMLDELEDFVAITLLDKVELPQ